MSDGFVVNTLLGMTPWLALSLGLWLGQTPYSNQPATPPPPPADSSDQDVGFGGSGSPPPDLSTRGVGGENVTDSDNPSFSTDQGVGSTNTGAGEEYGGPGSASAGTGAGADTRTMGTPSGPSEEGTQGGNTAPGTGTATPGTYPSGAGTGTSTYETGTGGAGTTTGTSTTGTNPQGPQGALLQPPAQPMTSQQMADQIQQLQAQVQTLQQQLQQNGQQLQQTTARAQNLQQNFGTVQSGAQQLEQLRQQRLQQIQRAWQWLVAADNALELGQLDVAEPLAEANHALGEVRGNASQSGKGETEVLMQSAHDLIAQAQDDLNNRNTPSARYNLQSAGWILFQARIAAQARPDVSLVTPPPSQGGTTGGR